MERGVNFHDKEVRAILDGTKSQTRIIVKPRAAYGIGDKIWVRETFTLEHQVVIRQKPPFDDGRPISCNESGWVQPHYRATDPTPELDYDDDVEPTVKWTSPLHMKRWASRITLEVTGVRVEKLGDITEEDAYAEGCFALGDCECTAKRQYKELWESIHSVGAWYKNPLVWVITFRRIK